MYPDGVRNTPEETMKRNEMISNPKSQGATQAQVVKLFCNLGVTERNAPFLWASFLIIDEHSHSIIFPKKNEISLFFYRFIELTKYTLVFLPLHVLSLSSVFIKQETVRKSSDFEPATKSFILVELPNFLQVVTSHNCNEEIVWRYSAQFRLAQVHIQANSRLFLS